MSLAPHSQEPFSPSPGAVALAGTITRISQALRGATYLALASLCALMYDTIITFDQEVNFVWLQRWSFGKATYILIRYLTIILMLFHVVSMLLFNPSLLLCRRMEELFIGAQVVILIAGSSILVARTWLLWGGRKWVLASLIIGLIVASILSVLFIFADIAEVVIIPNLAPRILPGCIVQIPQTSWRPFVPPLLYETLIIVLTVIKVCSIRSRAPVVMRLFLDGTLYYIVVLVVLLITTVGAAHPTTRPIVVGSGFHTACVSIGCSRLFLSLHSWSDDNRDRSASTNTDEQKSNSHSRSLEPGHQLQLSAHLPITDIESSHGAAVSMNNASSISPFPPPSLSEPRSIPPDIERPSLPEHAWAPQPQQQRRSQRPPRSSSLYAPMTRLGGELNRLA